MAFQLTPADMADATPVLAVIPSGTPAEPQIVLLPAGEFETDQTFTVSGKQYWRLIGGPTTLHFPTYGPVSNDGNYERRHCRFENMADFYVGGLKIHGPHTVRQTDDLTAARYDPTKAFQHGFIIARSTRVTVEGVEAYEIGGDGLYLNAVDDLSVLGLRVEFNGRQGFAGIDGNRWLLEQVNIVNAGRNGFDLEPIGHRPGTDELRWVTVMTLRDSDLNGSKMAGVIHRASEITVEDTRIRGKLAAVGASDLLAQRRYGIRILNNVWPDLYRSAATDTGPIQFMSVNGAEVRGNHCHRDPADLKTIKAPFVEMRALPVTGHIVVQGNNTADFAQVFKWRDNIVPPEMVTTDIQVEPSEAPPLPLEDPEMTTDFPIPDLKVVAWYAARHTDGVDGQTLSTIPDLSGNGRDLFQNNTSKRASYQTGEVNGLAVFRFDGTDWYKVQWGLTVPEPYTVFVVFNPKALPAAGGDEVIFSGFTNPSTDKHIFAIVNHDLATVNQPATPPDWMIEQAANRQHVVGGTPIPNVWYVARCDFETVDSITLNGVLTDAVGNAGSLASTGLTLGAREDGNRALTGDLAELLFCQDLTAVEKTAVEAELMMIYGITP